MTRRIPALALVVALLAPAALAGCGSGSSGATAAGSTATQTHVATVRTASTGLGTILVAAGGRTAYLFEQDRGPHSTCSGACLAQWPAVTTHGSPQAGGSASASRLGTTQRNDGTTQVTYAGHPLYYYAGDSSAGETNGQGLDAFGAKWYVVGPSGAAVTRQATGGSGASGNSGYGY